MDLRHAIVFCSPKAASPWSSPPAPGASPPPKYIRPSPKSLAIPEDDAAEAQEASVTVSRNPFFTSSETFHIIFAQMLGNTTKRRTRPQFQS
ncbi:hypothetical protein Fmac_008494 [Flemingia macrophylla]|uniref:Uncharacterized protein n=1 Tax=Flemingia macrophylla TaxID=520843 RepID=A0ABD1MXM5_9FABA